jgi:plasmid maintenance system antidote protein VapI
MTLREFFSISPMGRSDLAEIIGSTRNTVDRWVIGHMQPTLNMALKIKAATGWLVRPEDWTKEDG